MAANRIVKELVEHVFKKGDELVTNGAKNGAKNGVKNGSNGAAKNGAKHTPEPPRVLPKSDHQSNKLNKYGYNSRDWEALSDSSAGKQKPLFRGEDGRLNYHQFNGKDKESSFRDVNDKQQEGLDREQKGKLQTKREVRGTFLQDKPQVVDVDSHHITPVKSLDFLFDGLDEFEARKLINHFEKRGVYIGNDPRNAKHLSKPDHTSVHNEYVKRALLKYNHASLEGMPVKDRFKFANVMIQEIKEANEIVAKFNSPAFTPQQFAESYDRVHRPELAGYE